jgi:hypothetical protein
MAAQPSLSQYYKIWFEKFADKEWLVYVDRVCPFSHPVPLAQ